ncbi:MAG: hypothetical protein QOC67_2065, partial [Pseudonocardiales bacterium]|nr:hypothetical protein [Pseudonocardiales bacterium]
MAATARLAIASHVMSVSWGDVPRALGAIAAEPPARGCSSCGWDGPRKSWRGHMRRGTHQPGTMTTDG